MDKKKSFRCQEVRKGKRCNGKVVILWKNYKNLGGGEGGYKCNKCGILHDENGVILS